MRIGLWVVVVGVLIGLATQLMPGIVSGPTQAPDEPTKSTQQPTSDQPDPAARLQDRLEGLTQADDPQAYASQHNLTYENGKVQVVVKLGDQADKATFNWAVSALGGQVETSYEARVQVRVPRSALMKLARHPHVTFIRAPVRPQR
ncbi:MAG: hypothetical protein ABEK03_02255 [Candidatus Bipolaricaulia bacterium]